MRSCEREHGVDDDDNDDDDDDYPETRATSCQYNGSITKFVLVTSQNAYTRTLGITQI